MRTQRENSLDFPELASVCECGSTDIYALGQCEDCWDLMEQMEEEEARELDQHARENYYAE